MQAVSTVALFISLVAVSAAVALAAARGTAQLPHWLLSAAFLLGLFSICLYLGTFLLALGQADGVRLPGLVPISVFFLSAECSVIGYLWLPGYWQLPSLALLVAGFAFLSWRFAVS